MSATAFIYDIIQSEYSHMGYSDLLKTGRQDTLMKHLYLYDETAKAVTENSIFGGYYLSSTGADDLFKSSFILEYLNREIRWQTVDVFKAKLISQMRLYNRYLSEIYDQFDDIAKGKSETKVTANQSGESSTRDASATLPQDQIDLNMDSSVVEFADATSYQKGFNSGSQNQTSSSTAMDVQDLQTVGRVFDDFVKSLNILFLGVV